MTIDIPPKVSSKTEFGDAKTSTIAERLGNSKEPYDDLKVWLGSLPSTSLSLCDEYDRSLIDIAATREYESLRVCKHIEKLWSRCGINLGVKNTLFYAARAGNFDVCSYLTGRKCDVDVVNQLGRTPLFDAICSNSPRRYITVERLIKARADVSHRDENQQTSLFCAADCKHSSDLINLLLKARASPDALDINGRNAIFNAACADNEASVKILAIAKADVHRVDRFRMNALRLAIKRTCAKTAMLLLSEYSVGLPPIEAVRKFRDEHGDGKCIEMARDRGLLEIVEYLTSMENCYNKARKGSREELEESVFAHPGCLGFDAYGRNLLHGIATRTAEDNILEYWNLVVGDWKWVAAVNKKDSTGNTPLSIAAEIGNAASVAFLLQARADANAKDLRGFSPLFYAVRGGHAKEPIVKALVSGMRAERLDETLRQVAEDSKRASSAPVDQGGVLKNPKTKAAASASKNERVENMEASLSETELRSNTSREPG